MTFQLVVNLDGTELGELLQIIAAKSRFESKLDLLLQIQEQIRMKLEDFQAKIDQINANTTASAAAAQAAATAASNANTAAQSIGSQLSALREQIKNAGLDATQEASLLAALDGAASGTTAVANSTALIQQANEALATFLTETAAGPTEPAPVQPLTETSPFVDNQ